MASQFNRHAIPYSGPSHSIPVVTTLTPIRSSMISKGPIGPIILERKRKLSLIFVATQYEHITRKTIVCVSSKWSLRLRAYSH